MKITRYYTVEETKDLLRQVPLKGNKSAFPYRDARIILQRVAVIYLAPCQHHVYRSVLVRAACLKKHHHTAKIFEDDKVGAVEMETEDGNRFIHMPPIVEQVENDKGLLIVADGTHRLYSSICIGISSEYCWVIENVDPSYPYYAKPIRGGWAGVNIYDQLPDKFIKRDYVKNHKKLYRDYNSIFTNIQPER